MYLKFEFLTCHTFSEFFKNFFEKETNFEKFEIGKKESKQEIRFLHLLITS